MRPCFMRVIARLCAVSCSTVLSLALKETALSDIKRVYAFGGDGTEGGQKMKFQLGGKGANLAEMARLGLPVPPGFTITCQACMEYYNSTPPGFPEGLSEEIAGHVAALEAKMNKRLGDDSDPLLVSVRSGSPFSMPGMMDTVLNLGLNDVSVQGFDRSDRQRAFRVGLLPPLHPDVLQGGARHRGADVVARRRGVRERHHAQAPGARRAVRHRPLRR